MDIKLRSQHWLKQGMDLELKDVGAERAAAVCIIGVELVAAGAGREPKIRYALRFASGDYELGSRPLGTDEVERWLREGKELVREAFEWLKVQDGVSDAFRGYAAEYERAFEYGARESARRAKGQRL